VTKAAHNSDVAWLRKKESMDVDLRRALEVSLGEWVQALGTLPLVAWIFQLPKVGVERFLTMCCLYAQLCARSIHVNARVWA
jgi:hypothetical protein